MRPNAELTRPESPRLRSAFFHALLAGAVLSSMGCPSGEEIAETTAATACYEDLDLSKNVLPVPPDVKDNTGSDWDCFAWTSFAAVNWPSSDNRGVPDTTATFKGAAHDRQTVWETFKEKREIFRHDGKPDKTWNSPQSFPTEQIELHEHNDGFCADVGAEEKAEAADLTRHLLSVSKLSQTLDETAEVASEALESKEQLCAGHVENPKEACASSSPPTCCGVHGKKVGPRVWKGLASESTQPVYYEVRLNWDFFNYVISESYYLDPMAFTDAILGQVALPYRTAADQRPDGSQNVDAVTGYTGENCYDNAEEHPCGVGAIQIKSAWIQLPEDFDPNEDPATDDPDLYHVTRAIYYETSSETPETLCQEVGTFGLIGLHVIQRVHNDETAGQIGGAFVFSTWEHDTIVPEGGGHNYTYVNYLAGNDLPLTDPTPYPALDHALPVVPDQEPGTDSRLLPETQKVNAAAEQQLEAAGSVWQHYQLIGTQFRPYADAATSKSHGQPHFLANLVIETNVGLQQFQGLPPQNPGLLPPQYASDSGRLVPINDTTDYERDTPNITYQGMAYNQGGCMGCHGVAQQNGYSFSFVLLGGQRGADVDTETSFSIPAPPLPTESLDLLIGPGLDKPTQPPPPPNQALEVAADDSLAVAATQPDDQKQLWVLTSPIPGTPLSLQGRYQIVNQSDQLMIVDQKGKAKVGSGGVGGAQNFWRLVPHEIDVKQPGSFTLHVYNFQLRGVTSGLFLTRTADGGVEVAAAATDTEGEKNQLWQIAIAPGQVGD